MKKRFQKYWLVWSKDFLLNGRLKQSVTAFIYFFKRT